VQCKESCSGNNLINGILGQAEEHNDFTRPKTRLSKLLNWQE
jgi:hypothetical protein